MNKKVALFSGIFVFAVGGLVTAAQAFMAEPSSNWVPVYSCTQVGNDIKIRRTSSGSEYVLTSTCRDAGHGKRQYTMACTSNKEYKVSWTACNAPVPQPQTPSYVLENISVSALSTLNTSGYLKSGNQFSGTVMATVPATWPNYNVTLGLKNALPNASSYTYAFAWTDSEGKNGATVNEALAKQLVKNVSFSYAPNRNFSVTDSNRNKTRTVLAFARNNDGVSRVPNMPVEVDDVIALHVYLEPAADVQSPSLSFSASALKETLTSNNTYSYRVRVTASDSKNNIKGIYVTAKNANGVVVDGFWVDDKNALSGSEVGFGSKSVYREITRPNFRVGEQYSVSVAAYDTAGNVRNSSVLKVQLDNPDTTAPTIDANVSFTSVWDIGYKSKHFVPTVFATAKDNSKVVKIVLYHNTTQLGEGYSAIKTCENSNGVSMCSHTFDTLQRGNFYAQAWDAAGNTVTSIKYAF